MSITIQGRVGTLLLLILGLVYGLGLLLGFALPAPLLGVWLIAGCLLALVGA
jgi:hypothetical protein